MRIGCLQFAPQVGDVDNNLNRADAVLSRANPEDLDLLVLPELAFSGYNFKSLQEISPFLERSDSGITSLWARTIALRYHCAVTVGYPEKVDVTAKWPTSPEYYNSALFINSDGETIVNYRKQFLYHTDETWALEGEGGFFEGFIPGFGNTSIGICMDLNPYKFEAPWSDFEFAFHILEMQSKLVILTMAWMTREDPRHFSRSPNDPDMDTLTYWITRLEPLIRADNTDEIIVVFCNRTGTEGDTTYVGTSAVIGIQQGEVKVYGILGRAEKELLVVDTNDPPYAKLVYRPDNMEECMPAPEVVKKPNEYSHAPTPPLKVPTRMPAQKHYPPTITVPDLDKTNSIRPPDMGNIHIAMPPAPGPTPMALRPRVVIPDFPSIAPHAYPQINSAALLSAHSSQPSPGALDDTTPYPDSAQPYTFDWERKINGGKVAIGNELISPISSYGGTSPISPRFFGEPAEAEVLSPFSESFKEVLIGKRPEPFPWSEITADISNGSALDKGKHKERVENNETPLGPEQAHYETKPSTSHHTKLKSDDKLKDMSPENLANEKAFERPASPKSRNASRSRLRDRSDSALGQRDLAAATALLEQVTQRVQSVQLQRAKSANKDFHPGRPPSANYNNNRITGTNAVLEDELIHTATNPSIIRNDLQSPYRTLSRFNHERRSNFSPQMNSKTKNSDSEGITPPNGIQRPPSRAVSRGRTPGPKESATNEESSSALASQERSLSLDSTKNNLLHRRQGSNQAQSRQSRRRRTSSTTQKNGRHNSRQKSVGTETSEFTSFEQIVCPGCPVHGRSRSNAPPDTTNPISASSSNPRALPPRQSRSNSTFEFRQLPEPSEIRGTTEVSARSVLAINNIEGVRGYESASVTKSPAQAISTRQSPPSDPFPEPTTPKAMDYILIASFGLESESC